MYHTIRTNCLICDNKLDEDCLKEDKEIPLACYGTDSPNDAIKIPYNVHTCNKCYTSQTKYLGDLDIIYKHNHADSTGELMKTLHKNVLSMLTKYKDNIKSIVEVGASTGLLSDLILANIDTLEKYYIIDPNFFGLEHPKKTVIMDFLENVDYTQYSDANTLIISHVFEHFYKPMEILKKIKENKNLDYFCLVWPDLQYYKNNNNYHLLNTEHTYYVDNNFIIKLMHNNQFEIIERKYYRDHSVIYMFKRNNTLSTQVLVNEDWKIDSFINKVISNGDRIRSFLETHKEKTKTIWPCSVHTQYLLMYNPDIVPKLNYILDNSPTKINKYLYGYDLKCLSFTDMLSNPDTCFILNGGVFNKEIIKYFDDNHSILLL